MKEHHGELDARGLKVAIVVSRFNEFITGKLLSGSLDALKRLGTLDKDIDIYWTPGAFELPQILNKLLEQDKHDAYLCLGAVIRGSTPHFDYIAAEVTKGIANLSLNYHSPISFGVLTTDTIEQAIERAGTKAGNKGFDAAMSVVEIANLIRKIG